VTRLVGGQYLRRVSLPLQARNVAHRYGSVTALADVSLDVGAGQLAALVGESGSGKSTLLRCFNAMVTPESGSVRIGGDDVRAADPILLRRRIGYVPQQGGLLPHWTVLRNVALVPRLAGALDPERAAGEALVLCGLDPGRFGGRYPHELSGGQRQRAAIARALAAKQDVVLLDEPFGALDAITRAEIQESFVRVRREIGFTALLVTHDLAEAARLADTVVVMREGRVEQSGTIAAMRREPATDYVRLLIARADAAAAALEVV
jgi:osmoprotectant transport system ATP-binding protein